MPRDRRSSLVPALALAVAVLAACATPRPTTGPATGAEPSSSRVKSVTLLTINDVYRIEGTEEGTRGGLARLRTLRRELEEAGRGVLLLHAGDFLFPSFPSRAFDGEQMIDVLNLLDGADDHFDHRMMVVFGNHEFDKSKMEDANLLDQRVEESEFYWLGTNVEFARDDGRPVVEAPHLQPSVLFEAPSGLVVGIFGLTTDVKHPEYVESFGDYEATARQLTAELRARGADAVVALTHLEVAQDLDLLEALGDDGPDLIIGGHDHQSMAEQAEGRWVLKADADAVTAVVARLTVDAAGEVTVEHELVELGPDEPAPDPQVAERVEAWLTKHDRLYCGEIELPPGCLADELGRTRVPLIGEELEIRRFETNLGDWVVDQALDHLADQGAQVAFVNSGSLRLNQDIPAGPVRRQVVEELFAYPAPLRLLKIDGRTLKEVAARSVENWSGNGWWLQVAGFAFVHHPGSELATDLTLLTPDGPRPIADDEEILAVTVDYVAKGGDDYTMLVDAPVVAEGGDLKALVVAALEAAGSEGIAPAVEGRICNVEREGPCLVPGER